MTTPIGLAGVQGDILVTSPPSVGTTWEVTVDAGDHKTYTINDSAKRYWDPTVVPVVKRSLDSGSTWNVVSASAYSIQYVGGVVKFGSTQQQSPSPAQIKVDVNYYPYASIGNTTDWQFQGTNTFAESTSHQGPGGSTWSTFLPLLTTGKITCKKWWVDWTLATNLMNRDILVVSCVTPASNRYEAFCYVADSNLNVPVNALVGQDLTFQITNQLYPVV